MRRAHRPAQENRGMGLSSIASSLAGTDRSKWRCAIWIFSVHGFYSIGCANALDGRIDPQVVMIRARVRKHLVNLRKQFPSLAGSKILASPKRDYGYRIVVQKVVWATVLNEMALEQNWSNFKNEANRHVEETGRA